MNALQTAAAPLQPAATPISRSTMVGTLRALLLLEAAATLGLAIFLSLLAAGLRDFVGGDAGRAAEETVRLVAGFSFVFAILAAVASRGARRRRAWAWTLAAVLQLILAVGTAVAVLVAEWHPAYLAGFGLAAVVMVVLSTTAVRRALGQE
jgi:biotin transporter BioY